MSDNLRSKTIAGILWSFIERLSLGTVQFAINVIMARFLLPSDFGMIGMLAIFLQISQSFVDSGFASALIQRRNRTDIDFSTVFYFNIVIALLLYGILFVIAPWIACFYKIPELTGVTRVVTLSLVLNSLSAVHKVKLSIVIDFKTQSIISLSASIISGCIGIWMAFAGRGVWALVWQTILNSLILTILFYYFVTWKPLLVFSVESFRRLFFFGSKLLISGLIHTTYSNLYTIVIGKKFSALDLGYYTYARQIAMLPSVGLNSFISRVIYPVLSLIQDDNEKLKSAYSKYVRLSSYIIFPLMVGLIALAQPIVQLLLTDKWSGVVILLQILCLDWMFDHLSIINLNLLYVKGRSDLALKLEVVKKTIATLILFASIPFGVIGMCWGRVLYSLIATYLNTYYTKSLIGLSFSDQIKDILPCLLLSFLMGGFMYSVTLIGLSEINQLIIAIITGVVFYFSFSLILEISSCKILIQLIKNGSKNRR